MKAPWFKFHPQDWQGDEGLQMCSLEARGLWIEILCIMHKNGGYLSIGNQPVTDTHLAIKVGAKADKISELIGELESLGVFSRTRSGVIFSRRMLADIKKSQIARNNGKNGGNPSLCNERDIPPLVNQNSTEPLIPPKILDTRKSLEKEKEKNYKKEKPDPAEFEDFWNLCPRKVGKGAAEKSYWKARGEVGKERLHSAMKSQRGELAKREKQYIPHPSTWLNEKRYFDESNVQNLTTEGWPDWKFTLAAHLGEPIVHNWFQGALYGDGKLRLQSAFKEKWVRENYMLTLNKIFGNVQLVA